MCNLTTFGSNWNHNSMLHFSLVEDNSSLWWTNIGRSHQTRPRRGIHHLYSDFRSVYTKRRSILPFPEALHSLQTHMWQRSGLAEQIQSKPKAEAHNSPSHIYEVRNLHSVWRHCSDGSTWYAKWESYSRMSRISGFSPFNLAFSRWNIWN